MGRFRPDVGMFRGGRESSAAQAQAGATAVAEPLRFVIEEEVTRGHIEIRRIGGDEKLITVIEVISPTNKLDARARKIYVDKREAYYAAGVNVVEIDLLRAGEPLIDVPWDRVEETLRNVAYRACIRRAPVPDAPMEVEYYPFPLRQRLPRLAIPLRVTDQDVVLDLQELIDMAYSRGRYAMRLDYTKPPNPPLSAEDAEWTKTLTGSAAT